MGRKKPVLIGKLSFDSMSAYEAHCRHILDTQTFDKPLEGAILNFAMSVLERNEGFKEKTAAGIDFLTVAPDGFKSRCFYVVHKDGTRVHFSYKLDDSLKRKVTSAMRFAVQDQIKKLEAGPAREVHHDEIHFAQILEEWLQMCKFTYESIKLTDGLGNEIGRNMACPAQKLVWWHYHRERSKLVVLPKEEHQRRHSYNLQ